MRRDRGKRAERRGRWAESLAEFYLRCTLHRILARRWKSKAGEIDIIARTFYGVICFIEVKTRQQTEQAILSVHAAQQRRIMQAADIYLSQGIRHSGVRFDIIAVHGLRIHHIRDAWRPD